MEKLSPGIWLTLEQELLKIEIDGKPLIDLTAYNGIALWWFIRFRLFNPTQSTSLLRVLTKNIYLFQLFDLIYDIFTSIVCRVISSYYKKSIDKKRPTVMITVHDRDWKNVRTPTGRLCKGDVFFQSLISELQNRGFNIVTVTPLKMNLISGLKTMISRLKNQQHNLVHKEFNAYWSMEIWKKERDAQKHFREVWQNASRNEKLISALKKSGLERELPVYFNSVFGYVAKCLEIAKKIVAKESPDLIVVSSEHGIIQKSLMVAGKMAKIPTLALQHGTIGHIHKGYFSWKGSISEAGKIETPFCPIPDKTAVFGPYYYDILTKASAYPMDSVVVTGQPRYDILAKAHKVYDRERFCRKLNLNPSKKIALVVTENLPLSDGKMFLRTVLKALREYKDLQIVLKPHPTERGEWYKQLVKDEKVEATILSKDADTYEALYACDLFVASFSTLILEAILLGKLGVTMHIGKGRDPTPYFKDVTLRVYREEDLAPAIKRLLYDEGVKCKLKLARGKFVREHAYEQDGKATERVANLIEQMMKGIM
jgi:hypothetical protein